MTQRETFIHLTAGGAAGTVGAIVTCPLEVVKTRLQSSQSNLFPPENPNLTTGHVTCKRFPNPLQRRKLCTGRYFRYSFVALSHCGAGPPRNPGASSPGLLQCLRLIIEREGPSALFRGLGPNLVGVMPSRAIYFCTYSQTKNLFNAYFTADSALVHILSASCAGFSACTATNPIWFVKTRLQLDQKTQRISAIQCIQRIYKKSGVLGFYKGIVASYFGITETVIHFVIYEAVKKWLFAQRARYTPKVDDDGEKSLRDFAEFMVSGAISKSIASCIAYPHEVARTRLREEGTKYRRFWQTLRMVYNEEGTRGLYRGLSTQLIRQIPNTAIMMATYEAVVYVLMRRFRSSSISSNDDFYKESKVKEELV